MTLINWESKFSVGVDAMDQQHQRWFGLMNELHNAMREGKGKDAQDRILWEMIDYTQVHFAREEQLLQSRRYPQLLQHAEKHRAFTAQLLEMQKRVKNEEPVLTFELMDSLKQWLENHILKEDMKYAKFLASAQE